MLRPDQLTVANIVHMSDEIHELIDKPSGASYLEDVLECIMISPHNSMLIECGRIISHPTELLPGFDGRSLMARLFRYQRVNRVGRLRSFFTRGEVERGRGVFKLAA